MNLLEIKNLNVTYKTKKGLIGKIQTVHAVNNVSLNIHKGEILAIAGESGCGKSTLAKAIMKLVPSDSGEILLTGENILTLNHNKDLTKFYQNVPMIFQN